MAVEDDKGRLISMYDGIAWPELGKAEPPPFYVLVVPLCWSTGFLSFVQVIAVTLE